MGFWQQAERAVSKPASRPKAPPPLSRGGPPLAPRAAPPKRTVLNAPLPARPFAHAQHEAQHRVEASRPPHPVAKPYIPRLPNPTVAQTREALNIARRAQARAVGSSPSIQRVREYHQELLADPRNREYVQTLMHYAQAAQRQRAEEVGRTAVGGGENADSARAPVARSLSRAAVIKVGEGLLRQGTFARLTAAPAPRGASLPLLGTVIPASITQPVVGAIKAAAPGLSSGSPEAAFVKHALGDVGTIGESPLVAGLSAGKGVVDLAKGNPRTLERLGSGLAQGLEHGAVGELLQGHVSGAENAFLQHPVLTGLEAAGAAGSVGRGAGALARALGSTAEDAGVRGALARAGSTVRAPIALTGEPGAAVQGLVRQRTYSKDLLRKGVQAMADRRRQVLTDSNGRPVTVEDRGRTVRVLKPTAKEAERFQRRRANFESARGNAVEKLARDEAVKMVRRAPAVKGRLGKELVSLAVTGTLRSPATLRVDLLRRAAAIEEAVKHPEAFRSRSELALAVRHAVQLRRAAEDPRVLEQAPQIFAAAEHHARGLNAADAERVRLGVEPASRSEGARLSEYAMAHMGARHFTVVDHQAAERAARVTERAAFRRVEQLPAGSPEHGRALAEAQAARAARAAVSGRGPVGDVLAHEDTLAAVRGVRQKLSDAQDALRRSEHARSRLVGSQRAVRASGGMRRATDGERAVLHAHNADVSAARARLHAQQEAFLRARDAAGASSAPPIQAGLRKGTGEYLSHDEIRAHAEAAGRSPDTLAYLPHKLPEADRRNFHQQFRPGSRPITSTDRRTGRLYQRGATTFGRDLVREETIGKGVELNKALAVDKFIRDNGLRHPAVARARDGHTLTSAEQRIVGRGGYFTGAEAADVADRLARDGKGDYVPVTALPARLDAATRDRVETMQSTAAMETSHHQLLNERVVSDPQSHRARNVVLVPAHSFNQLERHLRPAGELERLVQMANEPFRMAVLSQPHWLTGNFMEPFFVRLLLKGAGVNIPGLGVDLLAARRAVKGMEASSDPAVRRAAQEIKGQQLGGLLISRRTASVHRTYEDFTGFPRKPLYAAHVVRNLPVVKQMADMVLTIPHAFFKANRFEAWMQRQAFGKQVREDVQAFTGSWLKTVTLGKQALADVQKGLVDTASQHRFMEAQYELLGQYDGFNPALRRAVQTGLPFLPWTLNSLRFVFWTVPAHHTTAFAGFAKLAQTVQGQWENEHAGLSPSAKEGTLRDALVGRDGGYTDVGRYLPYGASVPLVHGDVTGLTNTLLPQVQSALEAIQGRDPFGRELQVPKGATNASGKPTQTQKLEVAANSLAESLVPLLALGRRLREGGGTAYSTSTVFDPQVKPGTSHMSALRRTLDPFRPIFMRAPTTGGSSSTAPVTLRDAIRQGLREEATKRGSSPLREAIRADLRRQALGRSR